MLDKVINKMKSSALGTLSGDTCEIKVAMLGPRRAGKTSMLTAMYERFEQSLLQESIARELKITPDEYTMDVWSEYLCKYITFANLHIWIRWTLSPCAGLWGYASEYGSDLRFPRR